MLWKTLSAIEFEIFWKAFHVLMISVLEVPIIMVDKTYLTVEGCTLTCIEYFFLCRTDLGASPKMERTIDKNPSEEVMRDKLIAANLEA